MSGGDGAQFCVEISSDDELSVSVWAGIYGVPYELEKVVDV